MNSRQLVRRGAGKHKKRYIDDVESDVKILKDWRNIVGNRESWKVLI